MQWIVATIVLLMLLVAASLFFMRNLFSALIAFSLVSLMVSVLFVILRAPDVAMTEAAVGAGLATLMFAIVIRRTGAGE